MCAPNLCNEALEPWELLTSGFRPSFLSASLHAHSWCEHFTRILSWWQKSASLVVCSLASPATPKLFTSKRAQPKHTDFCITWTGFHCVLCCFPRVRWPGVPRAECDIYQCGHLIGLISGWNCLNFDRVFHKKVYVDRNIFKWSCTFQVNQVKTQSNYNIGYCPFCQHDANSGILIQCRAELKNKLAILLRVDFFAFSR